MLVWAFFNSKSQLIGDSFSLFSSLSVSNHILFLSGVHCREELSRREAAEKNFDLSTGQLSEEFRWELVIVGAELAAWSARLDVL